MNNKPEKNKIKEIGILYCSNRNLIEKGILNEKSESTNSSGATLNFRSFMIFGTEISSVRISVSRKIMDSFSNLCSLYLFWTEYNSINLSKYSSEAPT